MSKSRSFLSGPSRILWAMIALSGTAGLAGCFSSGGPVRTSSTETTATDESAVSESESTTPAPAYRVSFSTEPATVASAQNQFSTQPVVTIQDASGATVSSSSVVTLTPYLDSACSSLASGTLSNASATASSGVATFSAVSYSAPGTIYLKASSEQLVSDCTAASIIVGAVATTVASTSGGGQSGTVGHALASPMTVTVTDANGSPVAGVSVTWSVTSGSGSLSVGNAATDGSGLSSATLTLGTVAGTNAVSAAVSGLSGSPVSFTATATAGAASQVVFSTPPSASATAGSSFGAQPVVRIKDAYGNLVSSTATVTLSAFTNSDCSGAGTGTLNNASIAAVGGVATFAGLNYTKAETIYLKAASGSLTTACTTSSIAVSAGTASTLGAVIGGSQSAGPGSTLASPFIYTLLDSYGNPVAGAAVVWSVTAGGGSNAVQLSSLGHGSPHFLE